MINAKKLADCDIVFKEYQDYSKKAVKILFNLLKLQIKNKIKLTENGQVIKILDEDSGMELWEVSLEFGYIVITCYNELEQNTETYYEQSIADAIDCLESII